MIEFVYFCENKLETYADKIRETKENLSKGDNSREIIIAINNFFDYALEQLTMIKAFYNVYLDSDDEYFRSLSAYVGQPMVDEFMLTMNEFVAIMKVQRDDTIIMN